MPIRLDSQQLRWTILAAVYTWCIFRKFTFFNSDVTQPFGWVSSKNPQCNSGVSHSDQKASFLQRAVFNTHLNAIGLKPSNTVASPIWTRRETFFFSTQAQNARALFIYILFYVLEALEYIFYPSYTKQIVDVGLRIYFNFKNFGDFMGLSERAGSGEANLLIGVVLSLTVEKLWAKT
jgi:hypothetical protein